MLVHQTDLHSFSLYRTVCSYDLSCFVICLRKHLPNSNQSDFLVEIWDAETIKKVRVVEYKTLQSQFNGKLNFS